MAHKGWTAADLRALRRYMKVRHVFFSLLGTKGTVQEMKDACERLSVHSPELSKRRHLKRLTRDLKVSVRIERERMRTRRA